MQTDAGSWQRYQQLYQYGISQAGTSAETLYKTAIWLSKQREALTSPVTYLSISQPIPGLPAPLWRIEVLLYLAHCYQLQPVNQRLLLVAGCCSAIVSARQTEPLLYPALSAAKQLKAHPRAASVVKLLSSSYAAERKQAPWQHTLLSLLLTQSEYFSNNKPWQAQLASRLMLSQSDYELDILSRLLHEPAAQQPAPSGSVACLLQHSHFGEVRYYDNRALEHYLATSTQRSAPLLALASQLNRQQQSVQSVKLAIGIIGRDALPAALAQAELQQYLNALHHPWQEVFNQFYQLLTQALQLFMPNLQSGEYRLLALCCCAPLWFNPLYQRSALVNRTAAGQQSAFSPALDCKSETYLKQLTDLLQLYQLEHYTAAVTAWLQPVTSQRLTAVTVNLQLAWHSSLVLYCAAPIHSFNTLLGKTATAGNTRVAAEAWLQQLLERSQCYCPISLNM